MFCKLDSGTLVELTKGTIVPIDRKTMRGAFDNGDKKSPIHIVSA